MIKTSSTPEKFVFNINTTENEPTHTKPTLAHFLFFIVILFKKVIWCTFEYIAYRFEVIKFYSSCFVVYYFVEILIAQTKLNI